MSTARRLELVPSPDVGDAERPAKGVQDSPGSREAEVWEGLTDEELFVLTREGEREAFRILVERYEGRALHVARGIVGSMETAHEVAQEAFLKAYAARDRFDAKRSFATWFFRILRNQAVDRLRRQAPGTPGAATELVGDFGSGTPLPESQASAAERRELVRRVLDALPGPFREVLVLRELEGLACTDIARRLGTTPGTVRWRLHHARKLFREHWERTLGKEEGGEAL